MIQDAMMHKRHHCNDNYVINLLMMTSQSLWLTHYGIAMSYGITNLSHIGSGNGLMPSGSKPSPEPMLTYHQHHLPKGHSTENAHESNHCNIFQNYRSKIKATSPRWQWVNLLVWYEWVVQRSPRVFHDAVYVRLSPWRHGTRAVIFEAVQLRF